MFRRTALAWAVLTTIFVLPLCAQPQPGTGRPLAATRPAAPAVKPVQVAEGVRSAVVPGGILDLAVSPVTGALAVIDYSAEDVRLYTKRSAQQPLGTDASPPIKLAAGLQPMAVRHKRVGDDAYFIVGCRADKS